MCHLHYANRILCVWQLGFCLLVVSSNYFTKFHDFSIIIQFFSNSMIFPCMELFWRFSRFSMIFRVCGNLEFGSEHLSIFYGLFKAQKRLHSLRSEPSLYACANSKIWWSAYINKPCNSHAASPSKPGFVLRYRIPFWFMLTLYMHIIIKLKCKIGLLITEYFKHQHAGNKTTAKERRILGMRKSA